jgi:hypothetical protein
MEVFIHLPHSPDVVPSDFHLFWPLKEDLCECNFRSEEEVIRQGTSGGLSNQMTSSPEEFMSQRIVESNVQNVSRTTPQIMQFYFISFYRYITLYNFSSFHS